MKRKNVMAMIVVVFALSFTFAMGGGELSALYARSTPSPARVSIPGGEFMMGGHHDLGGREHRNDEVPVHTVRVDGFYMAAMETTNRE